MATPFDTLIANTSPVAPTAPVSNIALPFDPQFYKVTQAFGQNGEVGNDFALAQGTPVYALTDGIVHLNTNWTIPGKPVGWAIHQIPTGSGIAPGWLVTYGHMLDFTVSDGQMVQAGTLIGHSGGDPAGPHPGDSTGPHLEINIKNPTGQYVDPKPFLDNLFFSANGVNTGNPTNGNATLAGLNLPSGLCAAVAPGLFFLPGGICQRPTTDPTRIPGDIKNAPGQFVGWATDWVSRLVIGIFALVIVAFGLYYLFRPQADKAMASSVKMGELAA